MKTLLGIVIAVAICGYFAVYVHAWYGNRDQGKTRPWATVYAVPDAFAIIRDAAFRLIGWLFGHAKRNTPRAVRRVRIHGRNTRAAARRGRTAVSQRRADRRREPVTESTGTASRSEPPGTGAGPASAPRQRSVVTPIRQEPAAGPGPAPAGGAGPLPAGAIHPVFGALISWILDQEHPDSVDFEEFHRQLGSGFLSVGEAIHEYTEHLAEGGIGLDPIVVQAAAEVAEATGELSAGIVDIFRKFHAVYAGYLAWLEDGHEGTHNGRWVRPESA